MFRSFDQHNEPFGLFSDQDEPSFYSTVGIERQSGYNIFNMTSCTYIVECSDKTLYVGSTTDLDRRLVEHNTKKSGAHYTKIRRPVTLVYTETFETIAEARKRENRIKKLTRAQKLLLISVTI